MTAERSRIQAVGTLLMAMEKTVRAMRMYPDSHPKLKTFLTHSSEQFHLVLAESSPLRLDVDRYSLLLEDTIVYTNIDTTDSLAFLLYKDGIRQMTFTSGLPETEVHDLAAAFTLETETDIPEDDLATYLWEREFQHIDIVVVEDFFEEYLPEEFRDGRSLETVVREKLQIKPVSPVRLTDAILTVPGTGEKISTIPLKETSLSVHQLTINDRETEHLKKLIAEDAEELYFDDMLEIVFTVIRQEEDPEHLRRYFSLFENLLLLYLTSGPLEEALHLVEKFRKLARNSKGISPLLSEQIDAFIMAIDSPRFIDALGTGLESGKIASFEALPDLLLSFPPEALPRLAGLLESVTSMRTRKAVCMGLARLGERNMEGLVEGISGRPWYVARNIAYTFGLIGSAEAVPHLGALLSHPDLRVRKEVLRNLAKSGSPAAVEWIFRYIFHGDGGTRMQAIRSLPRTRNADYARQILDLVQAPSFEDKSFREKEALFRLLGSLSGDEIVPWLEDSLFTRRHFVGRAQREKQHLAAVALAALDTDTARSRLRKVLPLVEERTCRLIGDCLARPSSSREEY